MQHSTIISVLTTLLFLPALATAAPHGDLPSRGEPAVDGDGNTSEGLLPNFDPDAPPYTRTGEPTTITRSVVLPSTTILQTMDIDSASFGPSQRASLLSEIDAAKADPTDESLVKRATAQPAITTQSYWITGRLTTHTVPVSGAGGATGAPRAPVKRNAAQPTSTTQSYWVDGRLTTRTIATESATSPPRQRESLKAVDDLDRRFEPSTPMDSEADLVNRLPGHEHEPMATTSENPVPTLY